MSDLPELPSPIEGKRPPLPEPPDPNEAAPATDPRSAAVGARLSALRERARAVASSGIARVRAIPRKHLLWAGGAAALLIVVIALAAGGSDSNEQPRSFMSVVEGTSDSADDPSAWIEMQLSEWREAGLDPGGFADVDPGSFGAAACRGGAAAALEVTLCSFASPAAAAGAVAAAEKAIGNHTGVAVAEGDRLLIVADRRGSDPSGRTINALVGALRP